MTGFDGTHPTVSQSFRFGPDLAEEANCWLHLADGDAGSESYPGGARGDRGEDHVRREEGHPVGVVFSDGEVVEPDLVGEGTFGHEIADGCAVGEWPALGVVGHVVERVQAEGHWVPRRDEQGAAG